MHLHIRQCNNYLTNLKVGINDVAIVTVWAGLTRNWHLSPSWWCSWIRYDLAYLTVQLDPARYPGVPWHTWWWHPALNTCSIGSPCGGPKWAIQFPQSIDVVLIHNIMCYLIPILYANRAQETVNMPWQDKFWIPQKSIFGWKQFRSLLCGNLHFVNTLRQAAFWTLQSNTHKNLM